MPTILDSCYMILVKDACGVVCVRVRGRVHVRVRVYAIIADAY